MLFSLSACTKVDGDFSFFNFTDELKELETLETQDLDFFCFLGRGPGSELLETNLGSSFSKDREPALPMENSSKTRPRSVRFIIASLSNRSRLLRWDKDRDWARGTLRWSQDLRRFTFGPEKPLKCLNSLVLVKEHWIWNLTNLNHDWSVSKWNNALAGSHWILWFQLINHLLLCF